tara:strand:- start:33 stop:233 length:201 start_codon:yes stop_codon:yes gene_type:complete
MIFITDNWGSSADGSPWILEEDDGYWIVDGLGRISQTPYEKVEDCIKDLKKLQKRKSKKLLTKESA